MLHNRWYIHTKEYYSAIQKNEILTYSTTWLKVASESSQTPKATYCIIYSLYMKLRE